LEKKVENMEQPGPWVKKVYLELPVPRLGNNQADVDRLVRGVSSLFPLSRIHVPYAKWNSISRSLRESNFKVTVALTFKESLDVEVTAVETGNTEDRLYALAVDIGTTTVVLQFIDLRSGRLLEEVSVENPQIQHGADVLTRIQFAAEEGGLARLQNLVRDCINHNLARLCRRHGVEPEWIHAAAIAGNTIMTHFLLGLNPYYIRREPYIPVINRPGMIRASELGLNLNPCAYVFVFPNIGSYFGGDLISGILSSGIYNNKETSLLVDIGTNAEVVLGNTDWLLACAGAAGPALEGGVVQMGMRAGDGAIDHMRINPQTLEPEYSVMGEGRPRGLCGSAIIDLTAELFMRGIIDMRGTFRPERGAHLKETDEGLSYVVVPGNQTAHGRDITVSQVDIDILLRSKAAMYTILKTVIAEVGVTFEDIDRFYMAGTFGTYIQPCNAVILGMVPDIPMEKFVALGNSSVRGAYLMLINEGLRKDIETICERLTYLELNVNQLFMNLFSAARFIPHTDRNLFPSVKTDLESSEIIVDLA
jgi:uncharacterized 2Fe-2S/4Fe-4S cluster protein (DUF4445 family)